MPEHLNQTQLEGYRNRTLALGELVAVDTHLGGCEPCRSALAALADRSSTASMLSGIDQARFRHLSYEQMDDWVEDRLDPAGREMVMAHFGACAACARQLIAYQEYAPKMAEPIRTAAALHVRTAGALRAEPMQVKQSWWSFLKQPQYALGAAALVAFFAIATPWSRHSSPLEQTGAIITPSGTAGESTIPVQNSPLIDAALSTTELDTLPDSLREGAKEAITAGESAPRPAALKGLESNGDSTLEYPYSEVVAETQPVMRWKTFGDSYTVSLYDSRHGLIARRGSLKETSWTPPSALVRDRIYTWEVESGSQKHRGTFKVLGASQEKDLEKVRAEHGSSHLAMGAASEELGLLTAAEQQFEAMAKEKGKSQQAEKLLRQVEAFRK